MTQRDKEATKQKLIDAVEVVLERDGFQGVGINSIAKEAGVDKVLIYRYFKNMDGLLEAFAEKRDYYSNVVQLLGLNKPVKSVDEAIEIGKKIFSGQLKQVLHDPVMQEILLWELNHQNKVTDKIAEERENQGLEIMKALGAHVNEVEVDLQAITSLISAGIYYLVLRSRTVDIYNGVNLQTEDGWKRIESAASTLLDWMKQVTTH